MRHARGELQGGTTGPMPGRAVGEVGHGVKPSRPQANVLQAHAQAAFGAFRLIRAPSLLCRQLNALSPCTPSCCRNGGDELLMARPSR